MSRLVELEHEIEATDVAIIKLLITRIRLGEERHDLMDGAFPDAQDVSRLAKMVSARVGSMLEAGGVEDATTRLCVEQLYHGLVLKELDLKTTLQRTTSVPAWLDIARGRSRGR